MIADLSSINMSVQMTLFDDVAEIMPFYFKSVVGDWLPYVLTS